MGCWEMTMTDWCVVSERIQLRTIPESEIPRLLQDCIIDLQRAEAAHVDLLRVIEVFQIGVDRVAERRNGEEVPDDDPS